MLCGVVVACGFPVVVVCTGGLGFLMGVLTGCTGFFTVFVGRATGRLMGFFGVGRVVFGLAFGIGVRVRPRGRTAWVSFREG